MTKKKVNGKAPGSVSLIRHDAIDTRPTGVEYDGAELYVRELKYGEQAKINSMRQGKDAISDEEVGMRGLALALVREDGEQAFETFEDAAPVFESMSAKLLIRLLGLMNRVNTSEEVQEALEKNAPTPDSSNLSAGSQLN